MPDILNIQESLTKVMVDVGAVAKTGRNVSQNFNFRGVDAVVNAVSPALQKYNVVVVPHLDHVEYVPIQTTKGALMMSARVIVTYRFVGQGGDFVEATVPGEAFDSGDKATAKAMSVAFRTALLQALSLPTDEPDPDEETYERSAPLTAGAAPGESTAKPNTGQGSVTSPRDGDGAQAVVADAAASPTQSTGATSAGAPVDDETPAGDETVAYGEGASSLEPPAGVSHYLSKDDQALLTSQFGSKVAALNVYQEKFGNRIGRLGDITYEMRDEIEAANA